MRRSGMFVVAGILLLPALAIAGETGLFAPRGDEADRAAPASIGVMRARAVSVNLAALPGADGVSSLPAAGHTIRLDLFDDVSLRARMVRAERIEKGMSWVGKLEGEPLSDVVLVVYDGILSGSVVWPEGAYGIRFDGTGSVVEQVDQSQFPEDHCFEEVPAGALEVAADPVTQTDDGSLVDVLVVYTPAARAAAGGTSAMLSRINLGITETNTAYANSGVIQRLRLAGTAEVTYTESSYSTDLSRVRGTSDGYMDNVHALRDTYGADEVVFIGEGYVAVNVCGYAYLMAGNDPNFAASAFALVDRSCISPNYSFGHELGHNMGLNHAREDQTGPGAYSYSYGYKWTGYRTIMAYAPGMRILHFSNPNVLYLGNPTGVVETSPSSAYNALSLNNTRVTVANWRVASSAQVAVVAPNGGETWVAGSGRTISWTSANLNASATIKLSYTNGASTYTIATGLSRTATSYAWTVPSTLGTSWRVTVCSDVGGVCEAQDSSDASFAILGPPAVAVVTPNGGESWPVGSTQTIQWTSANLNPSATIKLTYTNGTTTNAIVSGLARTATSYNWTVPNDQASNWKVTVCSDVGGSCEVQDSSDSAFSITAPAAAAARLDWNGDGKNDLLWTYPATGDLVAWYMNGVTKTGGAALSPPRPGNPSWVPVGVADFNADGKPDVLLRYEPAGDLVVWYMNGVTKTGAAALSPLKPGSIDWVPVGVADFNADGKPDILLRYQPGGDLVVWYMDGVTKTSGAALVPAKPGSTDWVPVGVADFNADSKTDILFRHQPTGQHVVWYMNGVTKTGGAALSPAGPSDTRWQAVALADYNMDGRTDIMWQFVATGDLSVWFMNGVTKVGGAATSPAVVTPPWEVAAPR